MGNDPNIINMSGSPAPVSVTVSDSGITVHPDPVELNYEVGPDSVRWDFEKLPDEAAYVTVQFVGDGCLRGFGAGPSGSVVGSSNTRVGGEYEYSIVVYDQHGAVIAETDPGLINHPIDG